VRTLIDVAITTSIMTTIVAGDSAAVWLTGYNRTAISTDHCACEHGIHFIHNGSKDRPSPGQLLGQQSPITSIGTASNKLVCN